MRLERLSSVGNIIFDMDGTLINTALATVPACRQVAEEMGLPTPDAVAVAHAIGHAGLDFHRQFYPQLDDSVLSVFAARVEQAENERMTRRGAEMLYEGVSALLGTLVRRGFRLYIASTGSESHVQTALQAAGLFSCFRAVKCGTPDKTASVGELMRGCGSPAEWVLVGDKHSDAKAGRLNKIPTVAARYGFGCPEEWAQFDFGIETPMALLPLIEVHENTQ